MPKTAATRSLSDNGGGGHREVFIDDEERGAAMEGSESPDGSSSAFHEVFLLPPGIGHDDDGVSHDDGSSLMSQDDDDDIVKKKNNQDNEDDRDEVEAMKQLARNETNRMNLWRTIVLLLILTAAAVVSTGTYLMLNQNEKDDFDVAYSLFANTIRDALEYYLQSFHTATENMAVTIAQTVDASNESFPFATIDTFESIGRWTRQQTGMEQIVYCPQLAPQDVFPWAPYSMKNAHRWIDQGRKTIAADTITSIGESVYLPDDITPVVFGVNITSATVTINDVYPRLPQDAFAFAPEWHYSPPPFTNQIINYDAYDLYFNYGHGEFPILWDLGLGFHQNVTDMSLRGAYTTSNEAHEAFHKSLVDWEEEAEGEQGDGKGRSAYDHPHSIYRWPVFEQPHNKSSRLAGFLYGVIPWDFYLVKLLPEEVKGMQVILKNTCGQQYTYDMNGKKAFYRGAGDFHDGAYDGKEEVVPFYTPEEGEAMKGRDGACLYSFHIYPTRELEDEYKSPLPRVLAIVVGCTFVLMIMTFFVYDWFVKRRNQKIIVAAAKSNAIVSSMFPGEFRDKVIAEKQVGKDATSRHDDDDTELGESMVKEAMADFYPEVTIMFADVVGFTAWSSVRQPAQVFELLENLYAAFDAIAKRRRIFKVETVGDSYVAVAGLPTARKDHAVAMCRFSHECLLRMRKLLKELEVRLGPDTGDLDMRFGLHSGGVTAGVLRGDKARFQLFGDTMNTASRMESTGKPGKIQISRDTADLLTEAGKSSWFVPREEMITAKGKGMMITYFLRGGMRRSMLMSDNDSSRADSSEGGLSETQFSRSSAVNNRDYESKEAREKMDRCTRWLTSVLGDLLAKIDTTRGILASNSTLPDHQHSDLSIMGEAKDVVPMVDCLKMDSGASKVEPALLDLLLQFITAVSAGYHEHSFHNFEHASHVAMSCAKLLRAIDTGSGKRKGAAGSSGLLPKTAAEAIAKDPLAQFACIFAAVIHDVDHPGVPNSTLISEKSPVAKKYENRAISEQNSFQIAWALFLDDHYSDLRQALCPTPQELARFRQLLVNLILATDLMDKDLNQARAARWEKCFNKSGGGLASTPEESDHEITAPNIDLEATLILESLMQASDLSHLMQHWHVYRKWNKDFFLESYAAYLDGRLDNDPAEKWYMGEIGFFDFVVIPLAKRLSDSGAFGMAGSELLEYAVKNRKEWEDKGNEAVAEMVEFVRELTAIKETPAKLL